MPPYLNTPATACNESGLRGRSWGGAGERLGDEGTETGRMRTRAGGRLVPYHAPDTSPQDDWRLTVRTSCE